MTKNFAIEAENIIFSYPDQKDVLKGVSFKIRKGEAVALIGPNGAGKSTLLLHLNGLIRGEGIMKINGNIVNNSNLKEIRRIIGIVFQDSSNQLFMPSVFEDVSFGPRNLGFSKEEINASSEKALRDVGMEEKKEKFSHHLSVGEQRKTAIACVLAMSPEILALDEPTSNLDPRSRRNFINLLKGINVTKIIATHDLNMVAGLCERTILLSGGRIFADGKTEDILNDKEMLEKAGL